jgi:hypothetical protein
MSGKVSKTAAEQLEMARLATTNTLSDSEIQNLVAGYGYPADKIQEGKRLYENAVEAVNAKLAAEGKKVQLIADKKRLKKQTNITCQKLKKVSRAIFQKNPEKLVSLGLKGKMPRGTVNFLATAQILFNNADLPEVATELLQYGYDNQKVISERVVVTTFENAVNLSEKASADSQLASQDLKAALKKMSDWRAQYIKIARVALHDRLELLEKLGVRIYSSKTPAQRQAAKKAAATRQKRKAERLQANAAEKE